MSCSFAVASALLQEAGAGCRGHIHASTNAIIPSRRNVHGKQVMSKKTRFHLHLLQQCPSMAQAVPSWGQQRDTVPLCCFLGLKC